MTSPFVRRRHVSRWVVEEKGLFSVVHCARAGAEAANNTITANPSRDLTLMCPKTAFIVILH
jgi:hypothetical protein